MLSHFLHCGKCLIKSQLEASEAVQVSVKVLVVQVERPRFNPQIKEEEEN